MRFRMGVMIGFGAGYYLGAKAGRERYEELNRWIGKVRRSEAVHTVAEEASRVVEHGVEKAKDVVGRHGGGDDGNGTDSAGNGSPATPDYGSAASLESRMQPVRPSNVGP